MSRIIIEKEEIENLEFGYLGKYHLDEDMYPHELYEGGRIKHNFQRCDIRIYSDGKITLSNSEEDKENLVMHFQGFIQNGEELKTVLTMIGYYE